MAAAHPFAWGAALQFYAPLVGVPVSALYFWRCPPGESRFWRVVTSAHGAAIALLYFGTWALFWGYDRRAPGREPMFDAACLVCLALMVLAVCRYRGSKWMHLLQLLNLVILAWTAFVGGMAVTGNYL